MLIQFLPLWGPILLCCAVVFLIRWTERRDWKAAQKEAQVLMPLDRGRHPETYRKFRAPVVLYNEPGVETQGAKAVGAAPITA